MDASAREGTSTATVTAVLTPPDAGLVERAIREVEYSERLTIHRMVVGLGTTFVDIYSFGDLVANIFGTDWHRLQIEGSKADLMWVDPLRLGAWIGDVLGDREFADALTTALDGADHYKAQMEAIYPLFKQRAAQYEAVLNADGDEN